MSAVGFDARFVPESLNKAAADRLPEAQQALERLRTGNCQGSEWTGWFDWPKQKGRELAGRIQETLHEMEEPYDLVLVIGIGGSYLGTRAVAEALSHSYNAALAPDEDSPRAVMAYAGHHLSETGLIELLDLLERHEPVVNVISKSGTTTEPGVAFRVVRNYMERRFGEEEAAERIIATTDPEKGALRRLAEDKGYKTFEVPSDVGGRYSVLTAVGLVPLALAGFDIDALLRGADRVFGELREGADSEHPVLRYASCRRAAFEEGKRIELLSYSEPKLGHVVEWWKQLFGESEGKDGKGIFPAGLSYTTDLHSLGQYAQDGCRNLLETFLVFDDARSRSYLDIERRLRVPTTAENADELGYLEGQFFDDINAAAVQATKVAHFDGGVPCLEVKLPRLDEECLGRLFAFFETACAVSGDLLGVNPFDQPGVEDYKKNLFGLLGKPGFEELGATLRQRL